MKHLQPSQYSGLITPKLSVIEEQVINKSTLKCSEISLEPSPDKTKLNSFESKAVTGIVHPINSILELPTENPFLGSLNILPMKLEFDNINKLSFQNMQMKDSKTSGRKMDLYIKTKAQNRLEKLQNRLAEKLLQSKEANLDPQPAVKSKSDVQIFTNKDLEIQSKINVMNVKREKKKNVGRKCDVVKFPTPGNLAEKLLADKPALVRSYFVNSTVPKPTDVMPKQDTNTFLKLGSGSIFQRHTAVTIPSQSITQTKGKHPTSINKSRDVKISLNSSSPNTQIGIPHAIPNKNNHQLQDYKEMNVSNLVDGKQISPCYFVPSHLNTPLHSYTESANKKPKIGAEFMSREPVNSTVKRDISSYFGPSITALSSSETKSELPYTPRKEQNFKYSQNIRKEVLLKSSNYFPINASNCTKSDVKKAHIYLPFHETNVAHRCRSKTEDTSSTNAKGVRKRTFSEMDKQPDLLLGNSYDNTSVKKETQAKAIETGKSVKPQHSNIHFIKNMSQRPKVNVEKASSRVGNRKYTTRWSNDSQPELMLNFKPVVSPPPTNSIVQNLNGDVKLEGMDWEPTESQCKEMISDINENRLNLSTSQLCAPTNVQHDFTKEELTFNCIFVLDSNILMGHLKFVEHLRDQRHKLFEPLLLVIPWAVIQELDFLKDGRSRSYQDLSIAMARSAVNWINKQLTSNHPRVKGQTYFDLSAITFYCQMADDSILKCCIQLKTFAKRLVLLTNDVNLRNKASMIGVTAKSRKEIEIAIKKLKSSNSTSSFLSTQPNDEQILGDTLHTPINKDAELCDDILCKVKEHLLKVLTKVLQTEMEKIYGNQWINVISIKPEWILVGDVLKNFISHWQAVFSYILPKAIRWEFDQLHQAINSKNAKCYNFSLEEVVNIIESGVKIFKCFLSRPYSSMVTHYIDKLEDLQRQCNLSEKVPRELKFKKEEVSDLSEDSANMEMPLAFMYNKFNQFFVTANKDLAQGPSLDMAKSLLEELRNLSPQYSELMDSFKPVMAIDENTLCLTHPLMKKFHSTMATIAQLTQEVYPGLDKLHSYVIAHNSRLILGNALRAFVALGDNLNVLLHKVEITILELQGNM